MIIESDFGEDIHVVPLKDLKEHAQTRDCWCGPRLEQGETAVIVIHSSADGRELVEEHGLQ